MKRCSLVLLSLLAPLAGLAGEIVAPRPDARPVALVAGLAPGPLKTELAACVDRPVRRTSFALGHRGAPLRFPEHTRESYLAAAAQGAGVIECDVTFTRDKQLVCRHAQNDLHTTTDILLTPLAARCTRPFRPAVFDGKGSARHAGAGRVPHQRPHARRVPHLAGQARWLRSARAVGRAIRARRPHAGQRGWHRQRHAHDARREHRTAARSWACRWCRN